MIGSALFLRNAEADLTLALAATRRAAKALPNNEVGYARAAEEHIESAHELVTAIRKRAAVIVEPPRSSER